MRFWGNAVLSKHPFLTADNIDMEWDGTPSQQRVSIRIDGQSIVVYNIHFVLPVRDTPHLTLPLSHPLLNLALYYDNTFRNIEIDRLSELLSAETEPYVVGGDFNMSDYSAKYGALAATMHDAFRTVGTGFGGTWLLGDTESSSVPPIVRIDYVWHSDAFVAVMANVGPRLGSDHLPLEVVLAY
jgi:endonuclease/exonuclease/phosphatase (EEP) superfamily protein YafD